MELQKMPTKIFPKVFLGFHFWTFFFVLFQESKNNFEKNVAKTEL
jgi:hypothetical protein